MNTPETSRPPAQPAANGQGASLRDRVRSLRLPDRPARSAGGSARLPWFVCLTLAGVAGWFGYQNYEARKAIENLEASAAAAAESATTQTPTGGSTSAGGKRSLETGGYLIPVRRVQVSPLVGGQVLEMRFEEGQFVKKDEVLARIDPTRYQYVYRERKAQADMLKAEWQRLKENYRVEEKFREAALSEAESNLQKLRDRYTFLIRAGVGANEEERNAASHEVRMAEEKVKQFRQNLAMTREVGPKDVARAEENYKMAQAAADNAKYDLDNCVVLSPSAGVILKKYAEEGNMVRPEAFSNGLSASLYDLADLTRMEVDVDISERDLDFVFQGQRCEIRTEAFPDRIYRGHVARLMPEANRSKACVSARVRVEIPPGDTALRPELRARVKFLAPNK
jgi:HlyD family secretion protein